MTARFAWFRVLAGNLAPDHVTICRFRQQHQDAIAGLFGQVLSLCAKAGMVSVGTIAVDGTRVAANASRDATVDCEQLARTILEEAAEVDAAEGEQFGDRRGDELPEKLTDEYGRRAWLREAVRELERERAEAGEPVKRDREPRLREAKRRMDEELWAQQRANAAYATWRARGISADGSRRMAPGTLKPFVMPTRPAGTINLTDPDSRVVPTRRGFMQGYTAQAVTTEGQVVIAAEVICRGNERNTLQGLVEVTERELAQAGAHDPVTITLADAGFWNTEQIQTLTGRGIRTLVAPDNRRRKTPGKTRVKQQHYIEMREALDTDEGRALYKKRKSMIEPVFGQVKHNRRIDRFTRRGLAACRAEWRLVMATHNVLKLYTHHKLGLYRALAGAGGLSPGELADRTGTAERYVREWLNAQAAGGFIAYSSQNGRYTLPPEQTVALTDPDSPAFLPGLFQTAVGAVLDSPKILEAARSGGGVGWHEHVHDVYDGCERFFRPGYNAHLIAEWLPALDGVVDKLERGALVADVGCGHGASTILMAQAFPHSTFVGSDYHTASVETARQRAQEAGVADRVQFQLAPAAGFTGTGYDLVTMFDCLHDMGDPVGAARHVHATVKPDGTWMIVEPNAGDRVEDNLNPVGRAFYGFSTLLCTPASLSQEVGLALGAQAGEAKIGDVVRAGGFTRYRRAAETPFNLVYEARP